MSKWQRYEIFYYIYLLKLTAMTTKKITTKKTGFYSIGATIGKFAGGIIAGKNEVVDTVKSTIQNITTTKKTAPKKAAKATIKKVASKQLNPGTKKSSSSKKVIKPVTSKKNTPAKKVIKKAGVKK